MNDFVNYNYDIIEDKSILSDEELTDHNANNKKILNTNDKSQHKNNLDESLNQSCDNISFEKSKPFVNIVEKKKRGRKPKNAGNIEVIEKMPKKRGRKPTGRVMELSKLSDNKDVLFNECLIAHLKLDSKDINKILNSKKNIKNDTEMNIKENEDKNDKNDDNIKFIKNKKSEELEFNDLYDDMIYTNFQNHNKSNINIQENDQCYKCDNLENKIIELENKLIRHNIINKINENYKNKIIESKVNFLNKQTNEWKTQTDIACWWCCHKFDTIPLGLPNYYFDNKFYTYGCFCSLNCAYSYNLDLNDYRIWDRLSLIYNFKNMIDPNNDILLVPAAPRQTLELFGGHTDIYTYRENFFTLNKEYMFILPPLISIIGTIEENNTKNTKNTKNDDNNFKLKLSNKNNDGFTLKRNKPLQNNINNQLNNIFM